MVVVRSRQAGERREGVLPLVVVPGLGALGYLLPTVRACAGWTRVTLLDVPGFGRADTADRPADLASVTALVVAWLREAADRPVLLLGHSTGAQAALRAALEVPERVQALVLGGPTFPPQLRTWRPLVAAVARTARHESPGEVPATLPDYARGGPGVLDLLRSGMADRPEDAVRGLAVPVAALRGEHDHLSPAGWCADLVGPQRVITVPGAHNCVYTHPRETAAALRDLAAGAAGA